MLTGMGSWAKSHYISFTNYTVNVVQRVSSSHFSETVSNISDDVSAKNRECPGCSISLSSLICTGTQWGSSPHNNTNIEIWGTLQKPFDCSRVGSKLLRAVVWAWKSQKVSGVIWFWRKWKLPGSRLKTEKFQVVLHGLDRFALCWINSLFLKVCTKTGKCKLYHHESFSPLASCFSQGYVFKPAKIPLIRMNILQIVNRNGSVVETGTEIKFDQ